MQTNHQERLKQLGLRIAYYRKLKGLIQEYGAPNAVPSMRKSRAGAWYSL